MMSKISLTYHEFSLTYLACKISSIHQNCTVVPLNLKENHREKNSFLKIAKHTFGAVSVSL